MQLVTNFFPVSHARTSFGSRWIAGRRLSSYIPLASASAEACDATVGDDEHFKRLRVEQQRD
jgi:hypothetical protein